MKTHAVNETWNSRRDVCTENCKKFNLKKLWLDFVNLSTVEKNWNFGINILDDLRFYNLFIFIF